MKNVGLQRSKDNYILTGVTESCLAVFDPGAQGAADSVNGEIVVLYENNHFRGYIEKDPEISLGRSLLNSTKGEVIHQYQDFTNKWWSKDQLLYELAIQENPTPKDWQIADKLMYEVLFDSYRVESIDSLGDEIRARIKLDLKNVSCQDWEIDELLVPKEETITEKVQRRISSFKGAEEEVNDLWFINGTWNGGLLATKEDILALQVGEEIAHSRHNRDERLFSELSEATQNLVEIIRTLSLWREERKVYIQKATIAISEIVKNISFHSHTDKKVLDQLRYFEVDMKNKEALSAQRNEAMYVIYSPGAKPKIVEGGQALELIKEFKGEGTSVKKLVGQVASKGIAMGIVRVVMKEAEFGDFQEGEILVTGMTRPEFVPLMKKAAAIVCDEGGITSHAAIVSRELGKPCVIGTKEATQVLKTGQMVEVDANSGIVKIINE